MFQLIFCFVSFFFILVLNDVDNGTWPVANLNDSYFPTSSVKNTVAWSSPLEATAIYSNVMDSPGEPIEIDFETEPQPEPLREQQSWPPLGNIFNDDEAEKPPIYDNLRPTSSCSFDDTPPSDEKRERKRRAAIEEFVKTEEDYVNDLNTALDVFAKPLEAAGCFTSEIYKKIFINWNELIGCNASMLKSMRVRQQITEDAGPIESIADIVSNNVCFNL